MALLIVATPIDPPEHGKCWAFHVVNDSTEPIASVILDFVGSEWGDLSGDTVVGAGFGPIAPGASVEIWREADTELRMSIALSVRGTEGIRRLVAEFPLFYRVRPLVDLPVLGRKGLIGAELPRAPE